MKMKRFGISAPWFFLLGLGVFSSGCSLIQGGPTEAMVVSIRPHATYYKPSEDYVKDFIDQFYGGGFEIKRTAGHIGMAFSYDFLYEDGDKTDWNVGSYTQAKVNMQIYPLRTTFTYEFNPLNADETGFNAYVGGGLTILPWKEEFTKYTSSGSKTTDRVTKVTAGGHVVGGLEYYFTPELGIFGEGQWTIMPSRKMLGGKDKLSGYSGQVGVTFKF